MKLLGTIITVLLLAANFSAQVDNSSASNSLVTICTALESYKIDANGYPESLKSLFPTYIKKKPEEFLKTLTYEVKEEDSFEGAGDLVYEKFLLTYKGKDNIKGTDDDVVIDTHKVLRQPDGFGLNKNIIVLDNFSQY